MVYTLQNLFTCKVHQIASPNIKGKCASFKDSSDAAIVIKFQQLKKTISFIEA